MSTKSLEQIVNEIKDLKGLQLKELAEALEKEFGVSGMAFASAAPAQEAAASAEKKEEKDTFTVKLVEAGPNKINVIKALRQVKKDLGLTEAKKAVEEAPTVIAESVSKDEAKTMKETLEAAGAKVELT